MQRAARAVSLPAPVGGWDRRSALADMPAQNAVTLENWFPSVSDVRVRRGYIRHATGLPGSVETLMVYQPPSGASQLWAVSNGAFYNASAAGAVGAAAVSGLGNSRWQWAQMTNSGGHHILAVNGVDAPRSYDGTTWTTPTITGPTATQLSWINIHQRRIWFGESASLRAWYLAPNAISGTATAFDLAGLPILGGRLVAMGTWTRDGGSGPDDLAVFLTDMGEALVYAGTDPATAGAWALQGIFRIGRPVGGQRAVIKAGADLVVMTEDGFTSLAAVLPVDRAQQSASSLSDQINLAVTEHARTYGSSFGWQAFSYPRGPMMIFNAPDVGGTYRQFVFNPISGAPCLFTGVPARCWALRDELPFFGGDTFVGRFDTGDTDDGRAIAAFAVQAFNDFGNGTIKKNFRRVRPIFASDTQLNVAVDMVFDYDTYAPPPQPILFAGNAALWDVALWDVGLWAGDRTYDNTRGVRGVGRVGAIRVACNALGARPSWLATDVNFVPGGNL